jgi:EAL domain-containing protein (putative c-di-GMP-specific phosphodiesterase class I)
VLEIVEDEGIENYNEVSFFIETMKFLGCKIAIDDFGTGYSNFDYLMKLNVDFIKIDGSIIKNIAHDYNAKVVTELIVDFAQRLNIQTIAEFVYNKEVLDTVSKMGVNYSQGFYLEKPKQI